MNEGDGMIQISQKASEQPGPHGRRSYQEQSTSKFPGGTAQQEPMSWLAPESFTCSVTPLNRHTGQLPIYMSQMDMEMCLFPLLWHVPG